MLFGSWTHTSDEIDVDFIFPGGLDLSTFQRDFKVKLSDRIVRLFNGSKCHLLIPCTYNCI